MPRKPAPEIDRAIGSQIRQEMLRQEMSFVALGQLVTPGSKTPQQHVHQVISGARPFLTGSGRAIIEALGLEVVVRRKGQK